MQPNNNQAAICFTDSTYQLQNVSNAVSNAAQGLGLSSVGVGLIVTNMLSLELVSVLQVGYFGLSTVNNLNPILVLLYNRKYMNGYNNMLDNLGVAGYFSNSQSRRLLQISQPT